MHSKDIIISGWGSASALGAREDQIRDGYSQGRSRVSPCEIAGREIFAAALHSLAEQELQELILEKPEYRNLDRCVLLALNSARKAFEMSAWGIEDEHCGVSFGSSRGATALFEHYHRSFLEHPRSLVSARSSPTTTLGNVSSWVAQDLGLVGAAFSHSSTCSSAVHSIANAMAWIRSGMATRFLAGGSEAALTGFTAAQMQALGIYSQSVDANCACRPCALESENTFVLGEGAACFALESAESFTARKGCKAALARVESIGVAMEALTSPTSISSEADCLAHAMENALSSMQDGNVDALIMHTPGTIQGDDAELRAAHNVFGNKMPVLLSNKWLIGHTLGASAALSLEYALLLLRGMVPVEPPYTHRFGTNNSAKISKVMVNSAGFGGNAASLVVSAMN